jgi:hypothetical protein
MSRSRYSQEDVQQILQRAIARQPRLGEFTRSQLEEMAAELGISPQELEEAEREWRAWQQLTNQRREFQRYRQRQFYQLLGRYAIVNSFLVGLDWLSGGGLSWSLFILMGWGPGRRPQGLEHLPDGRGTLRKRVSAVAEKRQKQLQRR